MTNARGKETKEPWLERRSTAEIGGVSNRVLIFVGSVCILGACGRIRSVDAGVWTRLDDARDVTSNSESRVPSRECVLGAGATGGTAGSAGIAVGNVEERRGPWALPPLRERLDALSRKLGFSRKNSLRRKSSGCESVTSCLALYLCVGKPKTVVRIYGG